MRNLALAAAVAVSSLLSARVASAQTLVSTRVYGGAAGGDDEFRGAAAAPGGGYYLAGYIGVTTFPATGADIWVAKVDAGLNMVSSFTLNGSADGLDEAFDVAVGTDGMVYAVGATSVPGTGSVLWIGKFTSGLALVSSATFTYGFSVSNTSLDSMLVEPAGTLLVTGDVNVTGGSTGGRIWLARYSPSLVLLSSASFTAGFGNEAGDALALASNGDIYIGGGVAPAPATSHNLWIGKYNSALVFQASATVAGAGGNSDMTRGLAIGSNGDVYATGIINNSGATVDIFLGRYTANLAPVTATSVAGVAATNDEGEDLVAGYSGSLLLGGGFSENGQAENVFLGAVNESSLALSSSRTFASAGSNVDVANSVVLDTGTRVALVSGRYIGTGRDGFLALYNVSPPADPPAAPSSLSGAAQSASSIQWAWADNSSDETGFRVMAGTISLSGDLAANTTVWVQAGMGVNASSGSVFVRAFNSTGTADSGTATVYTLANVPVSLAASAVYASSAALSWGANGNPVGGATAFRVHYSTSASLTPSSVSSTTGLSLTLTGLTGSTSYYARMDALNGDSIATAYTSTITFYTSTTTVAPAHVYYSSGTGAPAGSGMYYAAAAAPGGGYYVVGYSSSAATGADILLAKVNAAASPVSWTKYSGLAKGFDTAYGVGLSSAGDVYVVGATSITGVGMQWWLGRYDSSLVLLASAAYTFGFAGDGNSSADAVFVKADGTVIVTGDIWTSASPSGSRIWTVRFSPNFNVQATFGHGLLFGPEYADSMHVTASGEYYKFGALAPAALTSTDLFIARTSSGDVGISSVMVAGAGGNTDQARGGVIGSNGDLYVTGIMNDSGLYNEAWIARYTPALVFVSSRVIAGSAGQHDAGNAIARGPGNTIVVAGQMDQTGTGYDIWLAQLRESDLAVVSSTTLDNSNASDIAHALVVDTAAATAFLAGVSAPAQNGWYALWGLSAPPAAPTGFAGTPLSSASIRWTWTDASSDETGFRVLSGTVSLSGDLPAGATQWVQTGLLASTSYGPYKAQAFNNAGASDSATASTATPSEPVTLPPAPSGFAGAALSSTSIRWSWTDNAANEDGYRVMSGTISLSGNLAIGTTQWLQAGLTPSTSYGPYHVQVYNSTGTADSGTASQATQGPNPPAAPSAFAGTALSSTSIRWSWADNAVNEDGYRVMSGTISLSGDLSAGTTQWVQTGLTPSTSYGPYFARVYNSSATADSAGASATTPAPPTVPAAPTGFSGTALGQTSILWSWNDNDGNEDGYRVMSGTTNLSGDLPAGSTTWTQTGLARNTSYGPYFARAFNAAGTADSGSASRKTLAGPPGGSGAASFSATAATITWTLNGNPAGTLAEVQRSTDGASYGVFYSSAVTSVRDGTLIGCTSYYYRVRHFNDDAVATAFDATVLVRTPNTVPAAPASITAEAVSGGRVAFGWAASPTEGITGYRLYTDGGTGTYDFGTPLAVFTSTESSWTSGVLASSAAYAFALRAVHRCGVEETAGVLASAASTSTLAAVRAAIKNPEAGKRIAGNRVTVMADLTSGIPSQVSQVVFQFRASTAAPWANIPAANVNHPNPDLGAPYFTHWDVTGLAQGPYQLRAVAYQGADADPAPGAITVIVDAVTPDITENVVAGEIRKQQSVNNAVVNTIAAGGIDASDALAKVVVPPGAVNTTTVTVTVETNPTITTASPAGFAAVGSSVRIELSNGQHELSGGQTACLTFSYPTNVTDPSALSIMSLNEATGVWTRDFATTVNASSRTVTGCTPHFSIFAVFQGVATATLLDGVRLYPNPYKPNSGNGNEGKPFSVGDDTTGIVIDNLPARVTIEIFSLSGRRVTKFETSASGGRIRWNARNSDGRDAASGGYFAVISSPGMKPIVKKFIIIR